MANKKNKIKKTRLSELKKLRKHFAAVRQRTQRGIWAKQPNDDDGQVSCKNTEDVSRIFENEDVININGSKDVNRTNEDAFSSLSCKNTEDVSRIFENEDVINIYGSKDVNRTNEDAFSPLSCKNTEDVSRIFENEDVINIYGSKDVNRTNEDAFSPLSCKNTEDVSRIFENEDGININGSKDVNRTKEDAFSPLSQYENDDYSLVIELEKQDDDFQPVSGRRIVDINYVLEQLQEKGRHNGLFNCDKNNFQLISEKRTGLISTFKFKCNFCKHICCIDSENINDNEKVNLNIAATSGIIATGIGLSQFDELCAAMDIPVFSPNYYSKLQSEVLEKWEKVASTCMEVAAQKEKEIAIAEGRTKNGYALVDVYTDGSWCARSYGSNYTASSGTAAIIGRKTGQILYIGVKNKYCLVCARAEHKNITPAEHKCFKNFKGSSSSMETQILVEGFKLSMQTYGIIYHRMIGDGDASTHLNILKANPYKSQNITVEKIECRNHILRNFCKKLRALSTDTKYQLAHRKTLTNIKIMTMRKVIVKSIVHHHASDNRTRDGAITCLHNDIVNSVSHAFGDHKMCQPHYCDKDKNSNREFKTIQNSMFFFRLNAIVSHVARKSRSLIENVDTNRVESFNNVIAKFIGGKRTNLALKGGYQGRCSAAAVSFNTMSAISTVQKAFTEKSPRGRVKEIERRRTLKRKLNFERPVKKFRKLKESNQQHDYGVASSAPDMSQNEFAAAKEEFLTNLKRLTADRHCIERATVLQRDCSEWLEIRKNLITASNFGQICKRKSTLDTAPLVKNILYKKNLANVASICYGIEHERQALQQLQEQENVKIDPCELFIDKNHPFIGATPDGLIDDNTLVEIKCPFSASKKGLSNLFKENKIEILKYDKKTGTSLVNKKSNWYYQIQGQLHVTERQECLLGIWGGESEPLLTLRIEKDDDFWKAKMEPTLVKFYMKCLLPEIVDSRHSRGMPIRNLTLEENSNTGPSNTGPSSSQPQPNLNAGPKKSLINFEQF